jgi:hypothetical protein
MTFAGIAADADERVVLFEGFGMKLEQITDAMTDKTGCALFVENGPIYLSVEGRSKVTVWSRSDDVHFAPDGKHLVRVGTGTPAPLTYVPKRKGLSAPEAVAAQIVKALASGQPVKLRYVDWPSYEESDVTVDAPTFAYVWGKAVKQCGWPSLGIPAELPEAKLSVYEPTDEGSTGYAAVSVAGNGDLGLNKGFDKFGGGCHISLGVHETIGRQGGRWITRAVDLGGHTKITVRDQDGAVVFERRVPTSYEDAVRGTRWPDAEEAAKAMWKAAPLGTVSITGGTYAKENVPLYGFRELWTWGLQKCAFPALE